MKKQKTHHSLTDWPRDCLFEMFNFLMDKHILKVRRTCNVLNNAFLAYPRCRHISFPLKYVHNLTNREFTIDDSLNASKFYKLSKRIVLNVNFQIRLSELFNPNKELIKKLKRNCTLLRYYEKKSNSENSNLITSRKGAWRMRIYFCGYNLYMSYDEKWKTQNTVSYDQELLIFLTKRIYHYIKPHKHEIILKCELKSVDKMKTFIHTLDWNVIKDNINAQVLKQLKEILEEQELSDKEIVMIFLTIFLRFNWT